MAGIHNPESDTLNRAVETLVAVLPRSVNVRTAKRATRTDLIVNDQPIEIKWVGEGTLGIVRRLLVDWRVRPDVVVARRMSPGAREVLSKEGIGWVDETGAAEIALGSIIVSRTGRPMKTQGMSLNWSPAVIAVAEALLCGTRATVSAAEAATGLASGSCTHALRVLTRLGLLEADAKRGRDSARRIADPDQFLAAYARAVESLPAPVSLQVGVIWRDPVAGLVKTGKLWDRAGIVWATTGITAASVMAPYLTGVSSSEVYVDAGNIVGLEAVAVDAGLTPVEGGRLTLKTFPTVAVRRLSETIKGLRVAPWPRVYVDLRSSGVRGEEAAEHLLEVVRAG